MDSNNKISNKYQINNKASNKYCDQGILQIINNRSNKESHNNVLFIICSNNYHMHNQPK